MTCGIIYCKRCAITVIPYLAHSALFGRGMCDEPAMLCMPQEHDTRVLLKNWAQILAQAFAVYLQVILKTEDGTVVGKTRVEDMGIGIYEAGYTAPAPGEYKVHVQLIDVASKGAPVAVRGSPFRITCTDPWTLHRVMGTVPTRNAVSITCTCG